MPLALTDSQIDIVMNAAAPLLPQDRSRFLEDVGAALAAVSDLGDGIVARTCREIQRRHFRAPDLSHNHGPATLRTDKLRRNAGA